MATKREKMTYLMIGLLLLALAAWLFFRTPSEETGESINNDTLVQETEMTEMQTEEENNSMEPSQLRSLIEEKIGQNTPETTSLNDVSGTNASGTAYRLIQEGEYFFKAVMSGLPSLEKGYYLEGWLVNDQGSYFSTGRVIPEENTGLLYYMSEEDKSSYTNVVITLEVEDGNLNPDKHILEGKF